MIDNADREVMLQMDNVSLSYHSGKATFDHGVHHVLDSVSFKLFENETLGIIGRNGVGKTTILRIMAGILAPTTGTVTTKPGKTSSLLSIGLGFKGDLSGRDNALLAAMLQGSTRKQASAFLEEIKEFSELGDSFEEPVKTYSSGMRSRLGFTTALMTHVDILLIDEVLSVGDAQFKAKALNAMKERICGDQTVVFVSHSDVQVQELCDRAIWIDHAMIASRGNTAGVLHDYKASFDRGRVTGSGDEPDYTRPFTDQRLERLQRMLELSTEQLVEMRKIRDEGGSRKDMRTVFSDEQSQRFEEVKLRRRNDRNSPQSS